ncbi:MAG: tetratricopeptide (TPR) repeat protein [Kiritimatiellia bacterium]|jgi:tetratricopeptide (TPR) repeat protein
MLRHLILVSLLTLTACDPYGEVKKQDTIEAYEQYLQANPTSNYVVQAKGRLEQLYMAKAEKEQSLDAYDAYLKRFPKGLFRDKARTERKQYLKDWCEEQGTVEAWQRFIDEYPTDDRREVLEAKRMQEVARYISNLSWTEPTMKQVNLAEDPEGPLNGWLFETDVTNKGDQVITYLQLTVYYLDDAGKTLGKGKWPVVSANYGVPVEEIKKVPIKAGETRKWDLLTGEIPQGWSKKIKVKPTGIKFQELRAR